MPRNPRHPKARSDYVHFSYQRRRTPAQTAAYRLWIQPDAAHVAKLRAGIEEFKQMLEMRYGRQPVGPT
jgi:hypothetical protein